MPDPAPQRRRLFLRGMTVLLPTVLTLWILWSAGLFVFRNIAAPINAGVRALIIRAIDVAKPDHPPDWYRVEFGEITLYRASNAAVAKNLPDDAVRRAIRSDSFATYWHRRWWLEASGLVAAMAAVYGAGILVGGLLGRAVYARLERWASVVPGFRQLYPSMKKLVDLVFSDREVAFSRVVAAQFPREGMWVIGFVTGTGVRSVDALAGVPCLTVFVPTTPTPFGGFTVIVPATEIVDLPMTVDQAMKFLFSAGVLSPDDAPPGAGAARVLSIPTPAKPASSG